MGARGLVLVMLFACSRSADPPPPPPPPQPSSPAADAHAIAAADAAPSDAGAAPEWGASVPDPKAEREAMELFAAIASGKAKPDAVLAPVFAIGPGLWGLLSGTDAAFARLGTPSKAALQTGSGTELLDMRSYLEPKDRKAAVTNRTFVAVGKLMMQAGPRAATDAERRLLYALSPMEIAGKPITVLETDRVDILVLAEDGKLVWIDAPGAYGARP
jgi:hypothetical protein